MLSPPDVGPDVAGAGDNGSGGKLNPAITAGLLITGVFLLFFALAPPPTSKLLFVRPGPLNLQTVEEGRKPYPASMMPCYL